MHDGRSSDFVESDVAGAGQSPLQDRRQDLRVGGRVADQTIEGGQDDGLHFGHLLLRKQRQVDLHHVVGEQLKIRCHVSIKGLKNRALTSPTKRETLSPINYYLVFKSIWLS